MRTIRLDVSEDIYSYVIFFLQSLKTRGLKIVEDSQKEQLNCKDAIDLSRFDIASFRAIEDPVKWQQEERSKWGE